MKKNFLIWLILLCILSSGAYLVYTLYNKNSSKLDEINWKNDTVIEKYEENLDKQLSSNNNLELNHEEQKLKDYLELLKDEIWWIPSEIKKINSEEKKKDIIIWSWTTIWSWNLQDVNSEEVKRTQEMLKNLINSQ